MTNLEYKHYLEAVDTVCGNCYGSEETCADCPVRRCCDAISKEFEGGNDN